MKMSAHLHLLVITCGLLLPSSGDGRHSGRNPLSDMQSAFCSNAAIERGGLTQCGAQDFPVETAQLRHDTFNYFSQYGIYAPHPIGVFNRNALPTEGLAPLWAAAMSSQDDSLLTLARKQLDHTLGQLSKGILFLPGATKQIGSNVQMRLAMGFWQAYKETHEANYLKAAEVSADIIFTAPHIAVKSKFTGRTYVLPAYIYAFDSDVLKATSGRSLDPNQDATLAVMAHILATEPTSIFFKSKTLLSLRDQYIAATLDMFSLPRCLPIADQDGFRDDCDSLYGWFAIYQMAVLNRSLKAPKITEAIRHQYAFYSPITLGGRSQRVFPKKLTEPISRIEELFFALGTAHEVGDVVSRDVFYQMSGKLLGEHQKNPISDQASFDGWIARTLDQFVLVFPR
jgi:hypothetical protein